MGVRSLIVASVRPQVVFPAPHSGSWVSTQTSTGIHGTPYDPGGGVESVVNSEAGLKRLAYRNTSWYTGNFATTNMNTFAGKSADEQLDDLSVSFGQQDDVTTNYSMTFLGYVYASATTNWDIYLSSDDESMLWIGSQAVTGFNGSNAHVNSSQGINPRSLQLTAELWYPLRIWYNEHTGGNRIQMFFGTCAEGQTNTLNSMDQFFLRYCATTSGLNPP